MATGYAKLINGTYRDADEIFEPVRSGDLKQSPAGYQNSAQVDASELFTHVNLGTALTIDFGYANAAGEDFKDLYALKNSVPRYPTPLPWDRTVSPTATVYRQPSRPTLVSIIAVSISIHADGHVMITLTTSPYNSNPNNLQVSHYYTDANPKLWTDIANAPHDTYEVLFELASGTPPVFYTGGPLGTWVSFNLGPLVHTAGTELRYQHNNTADSNEGVKNVNSRLYIHVRRKEYPVSNAATALWVKNLQLTVEPSVYQDSAWGLTVSPTNDSAGNYYWPEGPINTYRSAVRYTLDAAGNYIVENAVWKNNESPQWNISRQARWLRPGFSPSDFEVKFDSEAFDSDDAATSVGVWLQLGSTNRTFTVVCTTLDNSDPGTYQDLLAVQITIRQISTKEWVGLPDNFTTNTLTCNPICIIRQPLVPNWSDMYPWRNALVTAITHARNHQDPSGVVRAAIRLTFNPDGSAVAINPYTGTMEVGRWLPTGWAYPSNFSVQVVGTNLINNELATPTVIDSAKSVTLSYVEYSNSQAAGLYSVENSFTVSIVRRAYSSHSSVTYGSAKSSIQVNETLTLIPATNFNKWVGTYAWTKQLQLPALTVPNAILPSSGWASPTETQWINRLNKQSEVGTASGMTAAVALFYEFGGSGQLRITTSATYGENQPNYTDNQVTITPADFGTKSLLDLSKGPASDYEMRIVVISTTGGGNSSGNYWTANGYDNNYASDWVNMGSYVGYLYAGTSTLADLSYGNSHTFNYVVELQIRHVNTSLNYTASGRFNYSAINRLDAYVPGGSGSGGGGSGGDGCILPNTVIHLADGSTKLAKDLVVGDELLAADIPNMPDSSESGWQSWTTFSTANIKRSSARVTQLRLGYFNCYYLINGTLPITKQHPIWVEQSGVWGWVDARDIRVGDRLLAVDLNPVVITDIQKLDVHTPVIDIDVETLDVYFAGGYLVHNAEQLPKEPQ